MSIKPSINISAFNECAFRCACQNGYKGVAEWLLNIKPSIDISVENEYAFKSACINGHKGGMTARRTSGKESFRGMREQLSTLQSQILNTRAC